jgi:hypothetical protein
VGEVRILVSLVAAVAVLGALLSVFVRTCKNRHQVRIQRLQVLQEALRHPALDEPTRSELTRLLADDYRRQHGPAGERFGRWLRVGQVLLLTCGWLLLIGGIGFWIVAENTFLPMNVEPAIAATIVGAAFVTLPLALRELLGRRERAASAPQR